MPEKMPLSIFQPFPAPRHVPRTILPLQNELDNMLDPGLEFHCTVHANPTLCTGTHTGTHPSTRSGPSSRDREGRKLLTLLEPRSALLVWISSRKRCKQNRSALQTCCKIVSGKFCLENTSVPSGAQALQRHYSSQTTMTGRRTE